jgi:hypothetical protein
MMTPSTHKYGVSVNGPRRCGSSHGMNEPTISVRAAMT